MKVFTKLYLKLEVFASSSFNSMDVEEIFPAASLADAKRSTFTVIIDILQNDSVNNCLDYY